MMRHSESGRFATPMLPEHSFVPRLDAIPQQARIDPNAPLVAAWLGGRPVVLARTDPRYRRAPGMPSDLTVPLTISRFRRALDIESGRATMRFDPSLVDDWPLTHMPIAGLPTIGTPPDSAAGTALWAGAHYAAAGALIGAVVGGLGDQGVKAGASWGAMIGFATGAVMGASLTLSLRG